MHGHQAAPLPPPLGAGRPRHGIGEIFRAHGQAYQANRTLTAVERKAIRDIAACRTPVLGGRTDYCPQCGFERTTFNSCRNRHCPCCNAFKQHAWIEQRTKRLLPTPYFHVVFTVPAQLRAIALHDRTTFFNILFTAATETLQTLASDHKRLGAQLGITAILHTWARDLSFHPHIHCIVTGGGLTSDGSKWISARQDYLFPVKVLSRLFRGKMLAALNYAAAAGKLNLGNTPGAHGAFKALCHGISKKDWVVYCKKPFGGVDNVLKYLGRYTHRVGISDARILDANDTCVRFAAKDGKSITLAPQEFIRRFLLHVLPPAFVKIRHYGLLSAGNVRTRLPLAKQRLEELNGDASQTPPATQSTTNWQELLLKLTGVDLSVCPRCGLQSPVWLSSPPGALPSAPVLPEGMDTS